MYHRHNSLPNERGIKAMPNVRVRDAVQAAIDYLRGFPELIQVSGVRLEETELSSDETRWLITLSYEDSTAFGAPRIYKVFAIHAQTGAVVSMKSRNPFASS
jgi:hypothetical protein